MATVCFYGDLQRYGRRFKLDVHTAGEALQALIMQIPGLRQHMNNDYYRLRIAGRDISDETLEVGMRDKLADDAVIHIVPRAVGAKNGGVFSVIAGVVLIVAGAIVSYFSGPAGAPLIQAGIGLVMGGVAMMYTKLPKTPTLSSEKNNNTSFSNLDNSIAQGACIPLCYGEIRIGSKVLSQGLSTN